MATKKKGRVWNNLINHDSSINRGLHAPSMVIRSAHDHTPDKYPHGAHTRGHKDEHTKRRAHLGDLQDGHNRSHFHQGYRKEPLY